MALDAESIARFREDVPSPQRAGLPRDSALAEVLSRLLAEAIRAWPKLAVPTPSFLTWLATRIPEDVDLEKIRAADLYLACGCAMGIPAALAAFEERMMPEVELALTRFQLAPHLFAEVKQLLRHRLLLRTPERAPRIETFAGRGELRKWIQAAAVRAALDILRQQRREQPADESLPIVLHSAEVAPDLRHMREQFRSQFKAALRDAFQSLSTNDRLLLRQYYLDELEIAHIAALNQVHFSTAFRWITKTRETLATQTRALLMERLQLSQTEWDSAANLVHSQLDLTLRSLFKTRTKG
jgi:RNA polymerase sigma-70 factor (ECF subfamily)